MSETNTPAIIPNVDANVDIKDFKYRFNKDNLGNKRATVELKLPVPSAQGIVKILETGGKQLELLLEAVYSVVSSVAKSLVNDDEKISQESFPFDKITWDAIANQTRAERATIDQVKWEAFAKSYIEVMPGVTNKSLQAVTNATLVYLKKFSIIKTDKTSISKLKEQLGLYAEHAKDAEEYTDILELLNDKADTYLKADDIQQLVANL